MKRLMISSGLTPPHMAFQYQFRACPVMALRSLSNLFGERGEKVWIARAVGGRRARPWSPLRLGSFCAGHYWCLNTTMGRGAQAATKGAKRPPTGEWASEDMPLVPASR